MSNENAITKAKKIIRIVRPYERKISIRFGAFFLAMVLCAVVLLGTGCGSNEPRTISDTSQTIETKKTAEAQKEKTNEVTVPDRVTKYINKKMQEFIDDGFDMQLTNEITYHFKKGYHLGSPFVLYTSKEAAELKDHNDIFIFPIFDEKGKMILSWIIYDGEEYRDDIEYEPSWTMDGSDLEKIKDTYKDGELNEYVAINPKGYMNLSLCEWERIN